VEHNFCLWVARKDTHSIPNAVGGDWELILSAPAKGGA
jgi:hypothetical protein